VKYKILLLSMWAEGAGSWF